MLGRFQYFNCIVLIMILKSYKFDRFIISWRCTATNIFNNGHLIVPISIDTLLF